MKLSQLRPLLFLLFFITAVFQNNSYASKIDPRIKALGLMAAYGAVGGALLGLASLAYKSNGRAIPQGASLGLYAGLLFGGYIVISHAAKKYQAEHPADEELDPGAPLSPYEQYPPVDDYPEEDYPEEGGTDFENPDEMIQEGRWNPYRELKDLAIQENDRLNKFSRWSGPREKTLFYINIVNYQF